MRNWIKYAVLVACVVGLLAGPADAWPWNRGNRSSGFASTSRWRPATASRPAAACSGTGCPTVSWGNGGDYCPSGTMRWALGVLNTPLNNRQPLAADWREQCLARSNQLRAWHGRDALPLDPRLNQAAQFHAEYLARTATLSHLSNGGPAWRTAQFGFPYGSSEIIADDFKSIDQVFAGWVTSSGHYSAIVSDSNVCGFGIALGRGGYRYVGIYGKAPNVAVAVPKEDATAEDARGRFEPSLP